VKDNSSSLRQRGLGKRLHELRNHHGHTVADVTQYLERSATKMSRVETCARCPSLPDVRNLWDCCSIISSARAKLMAFAWEAQKQGWRTKYEHTYLGPVLGLRHDAAVSRSFTMYFARE
jgi:hypothetical protein